LKYSAVGNLGVNGQRAAVEQPLSLGATINTLYVEQGTRASSKGDNELVEGQSHSPSTLRLLNISKLSWRPRSKDSKNTTACFYLVL
jgi:hypothetical protein